jgi:hypothetical protein
MIGLAQGRKKISIFVEFGLASPEVWMLLGKYMWKRQVDLMALFVKGQDWPEDIFKVHNIFHESVWNYCHQLQGMHAERENTDRAFNDVMDECVDENAYYFLYAIACLVALRFAHADRHSKVLSWVAGFCRSVRDQEQVKNPRIQLICNMLRISFLPQEETPN